MPAFHTTGLRRLVAIAAVAVPAAASAVCTPVSSVPATLSVPGQYCLTQDLSFVGQGFAITIAANDVVLDLQGYVLRGPHAGGVVSTALTAGVYSSDRSNITVRNGSIVGFGEGVRMDRRSGISAGHLIENLHLDSSSSVGILLQSAQSVVRNNQITNTSGYLRGLSNQGAKGIYAQNGGFNRFVNNTITAVDGATNTSGINLEISGSSVIEGNQIQGSPNPFSAPYITGIQLTFSQGVTIANNRILRVYRGIDYGNQATGKYSGNITDDLVQVPYTGGTPVGSNF